MKNLVFDMNIPTGKNDIRYPKYLVYRPIYDAGVENHKAYAASVNAIHSTLKSMPTEGILAGKELFWGKLVLFDRYFDQYNEILFADGDLFFTPGAPNIFEEHKHLDADVYGCKDLANYPPVQSDINRFNLKTYINTGLFVIKREFRINARQLLPSIVNIPRPIHSSAEEGLYGEQTPLNVLFNKGKFKTISKDWNFDADFDFSRPRADHHHIITDAKYVTHFVDGLLRPAKLYPSADNIKRILNYKSKRLQM